MLNKTLESLESLKSALMQTSLCDDDIVSVNTLGCSIQIKENAFTKAVAGASRVRFYVSSNTAHVHWKVGAANFAMLCNALRLDALRSQAPHAEFIDENAELAAV